MIVAVEVDCAAIAATAAAATHGTTSPSRAVEYEFFVPTWTPGSYLIREYARHFGPVLANDAHSGARLPCRKSSKNRYCVSAPPTVQRLRLDYWVYAHELTVRTADVTSEHAFWNHACVLLWPVGHPKLGAVVEVLAPPQWDCVGGLPVHRRAPGRFEFEAPDFDALVDAPMLAGTLLRLQRQVQGVEHRVAIDSVGTASVHEHFLDHVERIVEQAAAVFDGEIPYPHYTFLTVLTDSGYGGLEHANSTTLLGARTSLARGKSYQEFLGLLAHELFHAWNIKRMRPAELWTYDYEVENHTSMLWLAEGFTAYYDDLLCRRARVLSAEDYLALVAKSLSNLWGAVGRFRQSLAEASYDAWIRHYRPDENTRNSTQNYYGNGALAAMVLDLTIRRATGGECSLDTAMAALYRETYGAGRGYRHTDVVRCLSAAAGQDLGPLLQSLTQGALDPEFGPLLQSFGVDIEAVDRDRPYLGFALESGRTVVSSVTDDTPAFDSGIAPGDEILALEGLRATSDRWSDLMQSVATIGKPLRVLLASRGVLCERVITPAAAPRIGVRLTILRELDDLQARLRNGWLGEDLEAADGK